MQYSTHTRAIHTHLYHQSEECSVIIKPRLNVHISTNLYNIIHLYTSVKQDRLRIIKPEIEIKNLDEKLSCRSQRIQNTEMYFPVTREKNSTYFSQHTIKLFSYNVLLYSYKKSLFMVQANTNKQTQHKQLTSL